MGNMASLKEGALNLRRVVLMLVTMGMALLLASGVAHASHRAAPANDLFADAQQITGESATLTGANWGAHKEGGEYNHAGNSGGCSVWYYWTPQESGQKTIDTFGSTFNTLLAVYTGDAVNSLSEVASNNDADGTTQSKVSFWARAGTTYRIAVDAVGWEGNINLRLSPDTTAPGAPVITDPPEGSYDNDGSFTISGSAEPNTYVRIFDGGNYVNGAFSFVGDSGNWSVELTEVSEGSHSYTATSEDFSLNTSEESETRTVIVDTIAPDAPVISRPAESSHLNKGSFSVSGTAEAGARVELFEGAVSKGEATAGSDGAWSIALSGVAEGSHSYTAKATDAADNASADSEARTVIVDFVAPAIWRVSPVETATGVAPGTNVSAFFSEAMRAASVKSAFKLYKKGSTTALAATVTYDAATKKAVLDPSANLQRGATYRVVVSTAARDLAGNQLDQYPSVTGSQQKVWFFTIKP